MMSFILNLQAIKKLPDGRVGTKARRQPLPMKVPSAEPNSRRLPMRNADEGYPQTCGLILKET